MSRPVGFQRTPTSTFRPPRSIAPPTAALSAKGEDGCPDELDSARATKLAQRATAVRARALERVRRPERATRIISTASGSIKVVPPGAEAQPVAAGGRTVSHHALVWSQP